LTVGGQYEVSATWMAHPLAATDAPLTVTGGAGGPDTVTVNQEQAPDDFTDDGVGWERLGVYTVDAGGTLTVRLTNDADEYVIADAVRIQPVSSGMESTAAQIDEAFNTLDLSFLDQ